VPANQIIILRRDRAPVFVDARSGQPAAPVIAHKRPAAS
jgi:hypothetical protein